MKRIAPFWMPLFLVGPVAHAHREVYHVDPAITEHAHMETEGVLGTAFLKDQDNFDLLIWEAEINDPWNEHWSFELVIPFGTPLNRNTGLGLGDIEAEPRWAFFNSDHVALNVGVPFLFPTGNEGKGLGGDLYAAEPTFRMDLFLPGADLYSNTAIGLGLNRQHVEWVESAAVVGLWRVTDEITLSPVAELTGTVSQDEPDSFSGAAGLGVAMQDWFFLSEFATPFIRGNEPAWSLLFHFGYHKIVTPDDED